MLLLSINDYPKLLSGLNLIVGWEAQEERGGGRSANVEGDGSRGGGGGEQKVGSCEWRPCIVHGVGAL